MHSRSPLIPFCLCATIAAALSAQGQIRFVGPVVTGDSAIGAAQLLPMPGMQVTLLGASTVGSPVVAGTTDDDGVVRYPFGFTPAQALIAGPQNQDIAVYRNVAYPPGSLSYIQVQSVANIPVAGGGTYDISAYPGAPLGADLTAAQCSAYYHVMRAHRRHGSLVQGLPGQPLAVVFGVTASGGPAAYHLGTVTITMAALADPNAAPASRSGSTLAHEYGHHVVEHLYLPGAPLPRMNEGMADFLASMVTDSPHIGLGVIGTPRDLDNGARYSVDFTGEEHHDGLVVGGALYHARELFGMHGRRSLFDDMFATALAWNPTDEPDLLRLLLLLDDDDNDLSNCSPNADLLFHAFATLHAVPWPSATGCVPTLTGSVVTVTGGWGSGAGAVPDLRASLAWGSTSIGLQATFGIAGQFGFFQGSAAPGAPLQLVPGLLAWIDPAQMLPALWFQTDVAGRATFTASLPPGLPALSFHGVLFAAAAPLGVVATNGVIVTP